MTTSWHVGEPESNPTPAAIAPLTHRDVTDPAVGDVLRSAPAGLLPYLRAEVTRWTDGMEEPPWGYFYEGDAQAQQVMSEVENAMRRIDEDGLNKIAPGFGSEEVSAAAKIGRLDGELTLEYTHPGGLLEDGWTPKETEEAKALIKADDGLQELVAVGGRSYASLGRWRGAMAVWSKAAERAAREWSREAVAGASDDGWEPLDTDYALRMMRYDATTHHGVGTSDSGFNVPSLLAHGRLERALLRGELRARDLDGFMKEAVGIGEVATQFKRNQPARKPVPLRVWDQGLGRPTTFARSVRKYPKHRDVWAVSKHINGVWSSAVGRRTTLLRAGRHAQVRANCVSYVINKIWTRPTTGRGLALCRKLRITNPDKWDIWELDYNNLDLSCPSASIVAALETVAAYDQRIRPDMIELLNRMPVLTPAMVPGSDGYVWRRKGKMLSGFKGTSVCDSDINVSALMMGFEDVLSCAVEDVGELIEEGVIDILIAGDDTLIKLPRCLSMDKLAAGLGRLGFKVRYGLGVRFLAKQYLPDGKYTNILARQVQNQFFEEAKSRQTNRSIVMAGAVQRRHLLRHHAQRYIFDDVLRRVDSNFAAAVMSYTAADIPWLIKQAQAEGIDDRAARGLQNLAHAMDADVGTWEYAADARESPGLAAIGAALRRRFVRTDAVYAALDDTQMTLDDVREVFAARSDRRTLPPAVRMKLAGVTLR